MVIKDRTNVLLTERLELRPLTAQDAGFLFDLYTDPEVIRYTGETRLRDEAHAREFWIAALRCRLPIRRFI